MIFLSLTKADRDSKITLSITCLILLARTLDKNLYNQLTKELGLKSKNTKDSQLWESKQQKSYLCLQSTCHYGENLLKNASTYLLRRPTSL